MSRSQELERFLEEGNEIIILDECVVESFKSNNPYGTLHKHFKILKQFPYSVFASYNRGELFREELNTGIPVQADRVICNECTETLRDILSLDEAQLEFKLGQQKPKAMSLIEEYDDFAEEHIRGLAIKSDSVDISSYRNDKVKLNTDIAIVSADVPKLLLENKCKQPFDFQNFVENKSMIFIVSFANTWKAIRWRLNRGFEQAKPKVMGNDGFDLKYVAISCYFDGILTNENWLKDCRESALSLYNIH